MKASELIRVLMEQPYDVEIRVGDQVESGPYLHASVGGIFKGSKGEVVICANDDEVWKDEIAGFDPEQVPERPVIWKP